MEGEASLGPGDGGHGEDYEFVEGDKDALGFMGVDRIKELKRVVREAWESKGRGHFAITPGVRQTSVLFSYGVQVKFVDKDSGEVMFFFLWTTTWRRMILLRC